MNKYKIMGKDGNVMVVGTELELDSMLAQLRKKVPFVAVKKTLPSGDTVVLLEEVEEDVKIKL